MDFKFRNRGEVRNCVDSTGLEYFVTKYCRSDAMPDDETKKAFEDIERTIEIFIELIGE